MGGFLKLGDQAYPSALIPDGRGGYRLPDGTLCRLTDGSLRLGDETVPVTTALDGHRVWVHLEGSAYELLWEDAVAHFEDQDGGSSADSARAPMPGVVISIAVAAGQSVAAGDPLMVIESMKLETTIRAPRAGEIEAVHVALGGTFERDALLVTLARLDA